MYIGTTAGWPGLYLPGVVYFLVGAAACLTVTLMPSHRRVHRPIPEAVA
jgi:UDP-GlcNAc:undecaprenyl-phosphate GlcNAc-1-phosphate transferase